MFNPSCNIVTGFLGSGKTTLLRHLLSTGLAGRRIAVVMNEIGDISIDGQVFTDLDTVEKMVELNSGCVCCSIGTYELGLALREIVDEVKPDMIVIETTGVATPQPIVARLRALGFHVDAVVTVVDAWAFPYAREMQDIVAGQIAGADFLVVNKMDLVDDARREEMNVLLREHNPRAALIPTDHGTIDARMIFLMPRASRGTDGSAREGARGQGEHSHVRSFSFKTEHPVQLSRIQETLASLPPTVYRAKGLLRRSDTEYPLLLNFACGRLDIRDAPAGLPAALPSQLVFIGVFGQSVEAELLERLRRCELTEGSP